MILYFYCKSIHYCMTLISNPYTFTQIIFGKDRGAFPCPLLLTSIHFFVQWMFSYTASSLFPEFFGGATVKDMSWNTYLSELFCLWRDNLYLEFDLTNNITSSSLKKTYPRCLNTMWVRNRIRYWIIKSIFSTNINNILHNG